MLCSKCTAVRQPQSLSVTESYPFLLSLLVSFLKRAHKPSWEQKGNTLLWHTLAYSPLSEQIRHLIKATWQSEKRLYNTR